jgi:hypothetical protein
MEPLEARQLLAVGPIISEFLADNDGQLLDSDGDSSDWIELFNPLSEAVDLDGWFLTDDAAVTDKWALPSRSLDPGETLVVFASGKNRSGAGPDFDDAHANFSLDADGEYLALIHPESGTLASEFQPAFPKQLENVSYGLFETAITVDLVTAGATAAVLVPSDDGLGTSWTLAEFSPDASWLSGTTGVGFDVGVGDVNGGQGAASLKVDFSQGDVEPLQEGWQGFAYGPDGGASVTKSFASDSLAGVGNQVEVTIAGNTHWRDYAPATGEYAPLSDLLSDGPLCNWDCNMRLVFDGLLDGAYEITLYHHTTQHGTLNNSREFTPFDILLTDGVDGADGDGKLVVNGAIMSDNLSDHLVTKSVPFTVVAGSPVEFTFQKPGERDHMALPGFELVRTSATGVIGIVSTDIAAAMHEVNTSAYVRTEFELAAGAEFDRLELRMQYNGGFVAYLNGTEIARRNAPEALAWNATAEAENPGAEPIVIEEIDVSAYRDSLLPGQTNVLAIHGLSQSADDDEFLILPELSGDQVSGRLQYFDAPSPGELNTGGFDGFVADTRFSVDRGIFRSAAEAFDVEITTATPGAVIVYTTDGSAPRVDEAGEIVNGQSYSTTIHVARTTTLRAAAFKLGFIPTNIDTHTYIFLDDVLNQSSTPPDGFPVSWAGSRTDWGLDQDPASLKLIAGDANFTLSEAREVIADSLTALPTMSIVMDVEDIFGASRGIYANTLESGIDWERPTSVELIEPDGTTAFQIDAGIRIQGNTSRDPSNSPKHSLRLVFRKQYGDAKLNYQFFDDSPVDEFDTLVLRSNSQDAWVYRTAAHRLGTFIRDQWTRETQLAMGQPAAHGNWVHLYINGLYWGVYNPTERPDASFAASYLGGDKDNYDALKNHEEVIDGNDVAYRELLALIQNDPDNFSAGYRDLSGDAAYQQVLGYVDAVNLADYMIHNMYAAASDWPGNFYMGRDRTADSDSDEGFRFFGWDNERAFKTEVTVNRTLPHGDDADSPTKFHHALRNNAEYRLMFADQLHRALFNGGVLYVDSDNSQWDPEHPERNVPAARFVEIAESIDPALIAESARWGDARDQLYTSHDQLLSVRDSLLTGWFPQRSRILLDQFREQGLYPNVAAAEFNQHGGSIDSGFQLIAAAPLGTIYYTTDGSDPRIALSGEVSPTARALDGPLTISQSVQVKTRVLSVGTWSALNEATFYTMTPTGTPTLAISEIHFNPADPPADSPRNNDDFEFVEFFNFGSETIDLNGVRLIDGVQFDFTDSSVTSLGAGEYAVVVKDMAAFSSRYDIAGINIAGQYSGSSDQLSNSGERIALVDRFDQTISDFTFKDGWYDLTDGDGFSLTQIDPGNEGTDPQSRDTWRPSSDVGGSPGEADRGTTPDPGAVIINELLTHTDAAAGDRIELHNTTDAAIDLAGWLLSDDSRRFDKYVIQSPAVIQPGGYLVFDQTQHFGNAQAAGVNETFGLSELGERAILSAADASGLLGYRATRQFGAADREVSFGRHVKSSGGDDFVAMQTQTFGAANASPRVGPIVIDRLRYQPSDGRSEFITLRNTSGAAVSLSGWSLDGVQFVFPPEAMIEAGGVLFVAPVDPQSFRAAESIAADVPVLGPYLGKLNNAGEDLRLFMPGDLEPDGTTPLIQVDRVKYDNKEPWPLEPSEQGASLQRIDPLTYGNDVTNWVASFDDDAPGDVLFKSIVINEILFRPSSPRVEPTTAGNAEPTREEFVELYNRGDVDIAVGGWQFTAGFSYTIPIGTIIPADGYLVVASDMNAFTAKYGAVGNLVGGDGSGNESTDWIGTLSNSGENIRLERPGGELVDRVRYADSGQWAVRRWLPNLDGFQPVSGWQWVAPHGDDGHSLELINPDLTNREAQNWAPSAAPLGTPGAANSVASNDIAPMIVDVEQLPAIPHSGEPVVISAEILNEGDGPLNVTLFYRVDPQQPSDMRDPHSTTPFIALTMVNDGTGVFSATVPGQVNRARVDYYVEASENDGASVRSYPAPSDEAGQHDANLLYQVDDSVDLDFGNAWPGDQPIYRLVMTAGQEAKLRQRDENGAGNRANDEVNATLIVHDPNLGTEVFHNVGVRIRGNSSRNAAPFNLRIAFPADQKFHGESSITLNSQAVYSQLVGHAVFQEAGLSSEGPVKSVVVSLNGINIANENIDQTYGSFVQLHARDGHLGAEQYPLDSGGNLYALNDRDDATPPGTLSFVATANDFKDSYHPAAPQPGTDTGYHKQSNASEDDWRDLVELTRALSAIETPDATAEDSLNFIHKVSQVVNVNQWLRHMAVTALIRNEEGGYATGRGDDYSLYRGEFDTRFELVPHDLDAIMDIQQGAGFGGTSAPIIEQRRGDEWQGFRIIEHPAFAPIFYGHLIDLMDTIYNSQHLDPIIDQLLGDGVEWVPAEVIDHFKAFVSGRETWVRDQIDRNVGGIPNPVSANDLSQLPAEFQSLADQQRFLRISEIMYNPRGEELEFVELINLGEAPLDLTGVHFKGGILFGFNTGAPIGSAADHPVEQTPETVLGPGERVFVVKNREAFLAKYDPHGSRNLADRIAGEFWNGSLSNAGERILLEGRLGEPILDFSFRDDWHDQTDGEGFSLVLGENIDQNTPRAAWGQQSTWQVSEQIGGTPAGLSSSPAADLTGNGFVDFQDLTILLAHWNQSVAVGQGNLVDATNTPVNFQDLTVLLAAWTGPGEAASPQAAAVSVDVTASSGANVSTPDTSPTENRIAHFDRLGRRALPRRINHAEKLSSHDPPRRRLQATAVDRAMGEKSELDRAPRISRRAPRRPR